MKAVLKYFLCLILSIIVGTAIFIALFHTPLLSNQKVLMYRGLGLLIIAAIILFILLLIFWGISSKNRDYTDYRDDGINLKDLISIVIVFICVNVTFFTLVPVTVERSVSVFTLAQMEEAANDTLTKSEAEKIFNEVYVNKNDAFGKRFEEQIVTGSIKENPDGSFTLTDRGHFLVEMFRTIGKIYNADTKNLY